MHVQSSLYVVREAKCQVDWGYAGTDGLAPESVTATTFTEGSRAKVECVPVIIPDSAPQAC